MLLGWVAAVSTGFSMGLGAAQAAPAGTGWAAGWSVGLLTGAAVGGFVLGLAQFMYLVAIVEGAGWWLLLSPLSGILLTPLTTNMFFGCRADTAGTEGLLRSAAYGVAYGVVTGPLLTWLLRKRAYSSVE
jgi:hypothetical protein